MRRRRRALPRPERARLALTLARRFAGHPMALRARRVACYLAVAGEMDLGPLIRRLWGRGAQVYVPRLHGASLRFLPLLPDTPLRPDRFGIPEPDVSPRLRADPRYLDLILVPLVAVDASGNRLGMGGGFYDRCLAWRRRRRAWPGPRLIGVAYEFQRVERLAAAPWDVRLDGVLSERGLVTFPRGPGPR